MHNAVICTRSPALLHGLVRDLDGRVGVIVIIDFFVLNRGRADVPALYASPETSRYGDVRWRTLVALLVGLVAGWSFEYGSVSLFQGPISRATNGVDFSWLASIVFGGLAYWLLCRSEPHLVTAPSLPLADRASRRG